MAQYFVTSVVEAQLTTREIGKDGNDNPVLEEGYQYKHDFGATGWATPEVFDTLFQPLDQLSFGHALVALKSGYRLARRGWNSQDQWIALTEGSVITPEQAGNGAAMKLAETLKEGDTITIRSHIDMKAADGSLIIGWAATQSDMLAEDWYVVDLEQPEVVYFLRDSPILRGGISLVA